MNRLSLSLLLSLATFAPSAALADHSADLVLHPGDRPEHAVGAPNGSGWHAWVGSGPATYMSYGPYVSRPLGLQRAAFTLAIDAADQTDQPVVHLDVTANSGQTVLESRTITRRQFRAAHTPQEFAIDFFNPGYEGIEFRVYWYGTTYVNHSLTTGGTVTPSFYDPDYTKPNVDTVGGNFSLGLRRRLDCVPRVTARAPFTPTGDWRQYQEEYNNTVPMLEADFARRPAECRLPWGSPGFGVRFGVNNHNALSPLGQAHAAQASTRVARTTAYWHSATEPDGSLRQAFVDELAAKVAANEAIGAETLVVVHGAPGGYGFGNRHEAYDAFAQFMGVLAARFPQVRHWQLWNEIEQGSGFSDLFGGGVVSVRESGMMYAEMLRRAAPAIRAVSTAQIVTAGYNSDGEDFLGGIYDGGGRPYFDVVATHSYGLPLPWTLLKSVSARRIMAARGDYYKEVWLTEFGTSPRDIFPTGWVDFTAQPSLPEYLDDTQVDQIRQLMHNDRRYGLFDRTVIYALDAVGEGAPGPEWGPYLQGRDPADFSYGLYRADNATPTPLFNWFMSGMPGI